LQNLSFLLAKWDRVSSHSPIGRETGTKFGRDSGEPEAKPRVKIEFRGRSRLRLIPQIETFRSTRKRVIGFDKIPSWYYYGAFPKTLRFR
jgi:hypothetical protein